MLAGTLICLSVAWLARAQTLKSLKSVLLTNGLSRFALYLDQFPSLSDQVKNGNVTILAPSDTGVDAYLRSGESVGNYSAELQALVHYHILPGRLTRAQLKHTQQYLPTLATDAPLVNVTGGQKLLVDSNDQHVTFQSGLKRISSLTSTDDLLFAGTNGASGILHVIDSVLTLPLDQTTTAKRAGIPNFVDLVVSFPQDTKDQGIRDGTIFAPNGTVPLTSNYTAEQLLSMRAYHFLKGVFFSSDFADRKVFTTQNGASVTITAQDGETYVNDAKITSSDYLIGLGVMHVLDKPLSPQRPDARPSPPSWKIKLPIGAYIGIAVGAILVIFTFAALLWHFVIRRRRRRRDCNQQENYNLFANTCGIGEVDLPSISRQFSKPPNNSKTLAELHSQSAVHYELDHTTGNKNEKTSDGREVYELG